jgi:hypothetical protein
VGTLIFLADVLGLHQDVRIHEPPASELPPIRRPLFLTAGLVALMVAQSTLGLLLPDQYRDMEWIRATWFGNDWVTLLLAAPLLVLGFISCRRLDGWIPLVAGRCGLRRL